MGTADRGDAAAQHAAISETQEPYLEEQHGKGGAAVPGARLRAVLQHLPGTPTAGHNELLEC